MYPSRYPASLISGERHDKRGTRHEEWSRCSSNKNSSRKENMGTTFGWKTRNRVRHNRPAQHLHLHSWLGWIWRTSKNCNPERRVFLLSTSSSSSSSRANPCFGRWLQRTNYPFLPKSMVLHELGLHGTNSDSLIASFSFSWSSLSLCLINCTLAIGWRSIL